MAELLMFEGFETCGDLSGKANRATVIPNIEEHVTVFKNFPFDEDPWLVDNEGVDGYAVHMGDNAELRLVVDLPTADQGTPASSESDIYTIGCRVHIPDPIKEFSCMEIRIGRQDTDSDNSTSFNLRVKLDGTLQLRRGSVVRASTASGLMVPGSWHYVEMAIKPDHGSNGNYSKMKLGAVPPQGIAGTENITVTDPENRRDTWEVGTAYVLSDEVRWRGKAYTATGASTGNDPDLNPADWTDDGADDLPANFVDDATSFGSFYILEDPDFKRRSYLAANGSPTNQLTNTGFWDYLGGDYEPSIGDTLILNSDPYYRVKVDNVQELEGFELIGSSNTGTEYRTQDIAFPGSTGMSSTGDEFIAYDDIYVQTGSGIAGGGFLGAVIVESLKVNADLTQQWTTSSGSDHYATIATSGNNELTYLETASNGKKDTFEHEDSGSRGTVIAVQVESYTINTTGGSPSLTVTIGDGGSNSDTIVVDNTVASELNTFIALTDHNDNTWDFSAIDGLITGIESSGI